MSKLEKPKRRWKPSPALLARVGAALMRTLGWTLRWRLDDRAGYFQAIPATPYLIAFWHNRIFGMPLFYETLAREYRRKLVVLTSPSRDGDLLEAFMARFGIGAVRGSTSRRGALALRELLGTLAGDTDVVLTPDGPRGPRYQLGAGLAFLAQKSGFPVLPICVEYSRWWELRSWDRFRIPQPFARVTVTLQPWVRVEEGVGAEAVARAEAEIAAGLGGDAAGLRTVDPDGRSIP